jgi:protein phosphatase
VISGDGLHNVVAPRELASFVRGKRGVQECADGLGRLALGRGARDNASCVVIEVVEGTYYSG